MKAFSIDTFIPAFKDNSSRTREMEPVMIAAEPSAPMGPLEIRRYVRSMRKNREFNFSCDFLY